jgi:hypothetical protein
MRHISTHGDIKLDSLMNWLAHQGFLTQFLCFKPKIMAPVSFFGLKPKNQQSWVS